MSEEGLAIERIHSYIRQLDDILGGGFPVGSKVLITGAPGTMKTTLAYAMLYNNAFADELYGQDPLNGIYLSLEQDPLSILKHTHNMGMKLMDEGRLRLVGVPWMRRKMKKIMNVHWELIEREGWLDSLKTLIAEQVRKNNARLLVLDSLTALMDRTDTLSQRDSLYEFFEWMGNFGGEEDGSPPTCIFIQEKSSESGELPLASYLADGTLHLFSEEDVGIRRLYLQCDKMRMTDHDRDAYLMDFEDARFVLNPVVLHKKS